MSKKRILSIALTTAISVSSLLSPAMAVEAAPSTVSEIDSLISELTAEENELSKKLDAVQNNVKENEAEAENLVAEMKATEEVLAELRDEIEQLKVMIEKREVRLQDQARALQIVGESGNVLNFVLNAESLSDIIGRVDVVSTLLSANKKEIDLQEQDKALVEEKESDTVERQEEQAKLAGKLESNKALLEEQKAEQESVLAKVAAEKAVAQGERSALIAQAKAAEARRQSLQAARTASNATTVSASSSQSGSVTTASSSAAPAPSASNSSVVSIASTLKGVTYHYGGGSTSGFDCSGFTSYVFNRAGRSLPRTASGQYASTSRISRSQAQPGDLVFFRQGGGVDHVGIYLGGGSFIGSQSSTGVAVSTINSGYWSNHVVGFGR